jgi:hypothetical protein
MRQGTWLASTLITAAAALPPAAARGAEPRRTVGKAIRHDVSRTLAEMAASMRPQRTVDRQVNPLRPPHPGKPDLVGQPDPLRQELTRLPAAQSQTPQPLLNFEGLSDDNNGAVVGFRLVPPDTEGDVGRIHYVQWINVIFAIYDKRTGSIVEDGGPFAGNTLWAGFGGPCETNNDGDPIVLYDHLAHRWLFSQFSPFEGIQCVALSRREDPRGPYDRWAFLVSPGQFNDYPKLGVMPDAYYLSLRDFPSGDGDFASAVAFDRAAMLRGDADATFIKFGLPCLRDNCPDGIQPPHLQGPRPGAGTPGIFSKTWDDDFQGPLFGTDGYRLWEFRPNFTTPSSSTFTELTFLPSAGFDSTMCGFFQVTCITQPAGGERLDPLDELQMYRAQFRHFSTHDSLVLNTTVDATGSNVAGIRWAELRNSGSGWFLHQEGTFAPDDGQHRWMGSAAMDKNGNIALGYSVSSRDTFPSIRYTSRTAADPPGTLPGGEVELVAGSDVQVRSFNRWGDYSTMSVDPVDGCTFWYTQEYQRNDDARQDFDFKTRIGAFKLAGCE